MCALLFPAIAIIGCSHSTTVPISYTTQPRGDIPIAGDSPIRVAVMPINADWRVTETNGDVFRRYGPINWTWSYYDGYGVRRTASYEFRASSQDYDTRDAQLWGSKLHGAVQQLLERHGRGRLKIVERRRMDLMAEERDLQFVGLVESQGDPEEIQWSGVDAYVVGEIAGKTAVRWERKNPYRAGRFISRFIPGVGGVIANELDRERLYFQRVITIAGNLRMIDASTGREWAVHEISLQDVEEEKSYPFKDASMMSMVPEEQVIQRLLDDEVKMFCSQLVPLEFTYRYKIKSSHNEDSQAGVKLLRAGDAENALAAFERAITADAGDDRSLFGAGVACELLRRYREACDYYRSAVLACDEHDIDSDDEEAQYQQALHRCQQRLSAHRGSVSTYATAAREVR
jgi:hypothetical protein